MTQHTEKDTDKVLEQLASSTRSPRGRFSAQESFKLLEPRLEFAQQEKRRFFISSRWLSVAAVIAVCTLSWVFYQYMLPPTLLTVDTLAQHVCIDLPDGSRVRLNNFSSLTYPSRFKGNKREVTLSGEGYFEVTKDPEKPFLVNAQEVNVEVLGTVFNIEAYPNNSEVTTTLLQGSVAVNSDNTSDRIVLSPDQCAIYNKLKQTLSVETLEQPKEVIAWQNGIFIFNKQPLSEIARRLSNSFGVLIEIPDTDLANYQLTARFNNGETLDDILTLLQSGRNFSFQHVDDKTYILIKN